MVDTQSKSCFTRDRSENICKKGENINFTMSMMSHLVILAPVGNIWIIIQGKRMYPNFWFQVMLYLCVFRSRSVEVRRYIAVKI